MERTRLLVNKFPYFLDFFIELPVVDTFWSIFAAHKRPLAPLLSHNGLVATVLFNVPELPLNTPPTLHSLLATES